MIKKLLENKLVGQFIKFSLIGLSNTILSYLLYILFLYIFENRGVFPRYDYLVSSVVTFCICTIWSFYWNNRFTFKRKEGKSRNLWNAFFRTAISYSFTGLFLQNLLLYLFVEMAGIAKEIVPFFNLIITVPLNFLMNKYWAFK